MITVFFGCEYALYFEVLVGENIHLKIYLPLYLYFYFILFYFILFYFILFYIFQEKRALLKTLLSGEDGAEEGSEGEEEEEEDESEGEEGVIYIHIVYYWAI